MSFNCSRPVSVSATVLQDLMHIFFSFSNQTKRFVRETHSKTCISFSLSPLHSWNFQIRAGGLLGEATTPTAIPFHIAAWNAASVVQALTSRLYVQFDTSVKIDRS